MKDKIEIPSHSLLLVNHKFEHLVGFTCYIGVKQAWTSILSHQNLIIHINQTILDMVFKNGGKKTLKIFTSMISFFIPDFFHNFYNYIRNFKQNLIYVHNHAFVTNSLKPG